jgi:uncharacterized protein YegL
MLNDFVRQDARPLPVILLLDVSGSMYGGKISALNAAVKEMITSFSDEESTKAAIHVSIITFGGEAKLHTPLMPAREIEYNALSADGGTPLGQAFDIAKNLLEDKTKIPSRSYRPSVILVSDGHPTDSWERKMSSFINEGRTAKCDRWALGIGNDADLNMLKSFINDPEKRVFKAEDASDISKFFRFITMSTTTRSKSANPNAVTAEVKAFDPFSSDDFDF